MGKDRDTDSDELTSDEKRINYREMYPYSNGRRSRSRSGVMEKPKLKTSPPTPAFFPDEPPKRPELPKTRVQFETKYGGHRSLIDLTYEVMCEDIGRDVDTIHAILEANGYETSAVTIASITRDLRRVIKAAERMRFVKVLDDRWHEQSKSR